MLSILATREEQIAEIKRARASASMPGESVQRKIIRDCGLPQYAIDTLINMHGSRPLGIDMALQLNLPRAMRLPQDEALEKAGSLRGNKTWFQFGISEETNNEVRQALCKFTLSFNQIVCCCVALEMEAATPEQSCLPSPVPGVPNAGRMRAGGRFPFLVTIKINNGLIDRLNGTMNGLSNSLRGRMEENLAKVENLNHAALRRQAALAMSGAKSTSVRVASELHEQLERVAHEKQIGLSSLASALVAME